MSANNGNTPEENIDHAFVRTQETADYTPDKTTSKSWEAIRDECDSGGAMDERCNIVAASMGKGTLDVIAKRLSCGCLLVATEALDSLDWDIGTQEAG